MSKSEGNWEGSYKIGREPLSLQGRMTQVGSVCFIRPKSSLAFSIKWLLGFLLLGGIGIVNLQRRVLGGIGGGAVIAGVGVWIGGRVVAGVGVRTAWLLVVGLAGA